MENFYEPERNNTFVHNLKSFFSNLFGKSKLLEEHNSSGIMQKLNWLKETGEEFVLDANDIALELNNYDKSLDTEKDLVLVYASNRAPVKNKILTPHEENAKEDVDISFGKRKKYTINLSTSYHDSIHFCINSYYSNEKCKYAIFIPLPKVNAQIFGGKECDLFTSGSVSLDKNTYILCPENEVEDIKASNTKAKVIGFKGENACLYINKFLNLGLGYKYKEPDIDEKEWRKDTLDKEFIYKVFMKNKWFIGDYIDTDLVIDENRKECTEKIAKAILYVKENNLLEENEQKAKEILLDIYGCGNLERSYSFIIDYSIDKKFKNNFNFIIKKTTGVKLGTLNRWKNNCSIEVKQDLKQLLCEKTIYDLKK